MTPKRLNIAFKAYRLLSISIFFVFIGLASSQTLSQESIAPDSNQIHGLTPHKAEYRAHIQKGISLSGSAIRELSRQQDGSWLYSFNVSTTPADIFESTVIQATNTTIQPQQYRYDLTGILIKDRKQRVEFDWAHSKLSESYKKKSWSLPAKPDLQDRLSYQLQLQLDVSSNKEHFNYQVIHKGEVRQYDFTKTGEEAIETSLGTKNAIVITKDRSPDKQRQTTLWFDKGYPNILLKMIQVEDDGETYEINISNLTL
jgi:hypothetical protein